MTRAVCLFGAALLVTTLTTVPAFAQKKSAAEILSDSFARVERGDRTLSFTGDPVGVLRIVDGDTFAHAGFRFRLHGLDAPERGQPGFDAATAALELVFATGGQLTCTPIDIDVYKRLVVQCRVSTSDIGSLLVTSGYARAAPSFSEKYVEDEALAQRRRAGLWRCGRPAPPEWNRIKSGWCAKNK